MILCFKFCSVALNASFCLKKRKLQKNKSEAFRVKIPQRKVTKFKTQKSFLLFCSIRNTYLNLSKTHGKNTGKNHPSNLSKSENKDENKKTMA